MNQVMKQTPCIGLWHTSSNCTVAGRVCRLHCVSYQTDPALSPCEMCIALSRSLVKTEAARPYMVSLPLSMASLMSLKRMICITGPKICINVNKEIKVCLQTNIETVSTIDGNTSVVSYSRVAALFPEASASLQALAYLFASNSHVVLDVSKDCGLDEVSDVAISGAPGAQLGTFLLATFDQVQNLLHLVVVYL